MVDRGGSVGASEIDRSSKLNLERQELDVDKFIDAHFHDENGKPAGGISSGPGYAIAWQNGPCPIEPDGSQPKRNGAFLIEVLEAGAKRLEFYQDGEFACEENADALANLQSAIQRLCTRRGRRKDTGTLGTHEKD